MNDRIETLTENQFRINKRISQLETDLIVLCLASLTLFGILYLSTRN